MRKIKNYQEFTNEEINWKKGVATAALGASLLGGTLTSCKKEDIKPINQTEITNTSNDTSIENINDEKSKYFSFDIDKYIHIGKGDSEIKLFKNDTLINSEINKVVFGDTLKEGDIIRININNIKQFCDHHGFYNGPGAPNVDISDPVWYAPSGNWQGALANEHTTNGGSMFSNVNKNKTLYMGPSIWDPIQSGVIAYSWPNPSQNAGSSPEHSGFPCGGHYVTTHNGLVGTQQYGQDCDHSDAIKIDINGDGVSFSNVLGGKSESHAMTMVYGTSYYQAYGIHHSFLPINPSIGGSNKPDGKVTITVKIIKSEGVLLPEVTYE